MTSSQTVLRIDFESAEAFQREYAANLENGGVFVSTREALALREIVQVQLALAGVSRDVLLEGEVVHIVPVEMEGAGAEPGVAIQFTAEKGALRAAFEPFITACGVPRHPPPDQGRRRAPRVPALVPVHVEAGDEVIAAHTRNISQSGVLVSMPGQGLPVGQAVNLTITHPTSGQAMCIEGTVMRAIGTEGDVVALGIEFDPSPERHDEVASFIEDLQTAEHTRRLGGIYGSIGEIGILNLLQMFGKTTPSGTLMVRREDEEGIVGFEAGLLRYARLGAITSVKALVRMLAWETGSFEFHARLEAFESPDPPLPLEGALLDATRQVDERSRLDRSEMPEKAAVRFVCEPSGPGRDSMTKVEEAVLELARVGSTVQRIVDVIPDEDVDIYKALAFLEDLGAISIAK